VKLSVVGSGKSGIWRRERIRMTDQELDDVAFLTGIIDELGQDFFLFLFSSFVLFSFFHPININILHANAIIVISSCRI
jgi:hypothetical protein